MFFQFVNRLARLFLLVAVLLGCVAVDAALKELKAVKLQKLIARGLVKGDHPPPGVHPNPPNPAVFVLVSGQCDPPFPVPNVPFPFYAIFV